MKVNRDTAAELPMPGNLYKDITVEGTEPHSTICSVKRLCNETQMGDVGVGRSTELWPGSC